MNKKYANDYVVVVPYGHRTNRRAPVLVFGGAVPSDYVFA
jgi:hypothetical protein